MVAFVMVMHHVLGQRPTKVLLTERNHPLQALFFDRADEPLRVCVAIRRAERLLNDLHTRAFKQLPNREAPLAIAVAQE